MKKPIIYCGRYLLPIAAAPIENGALLVRDGRIAAVGGAAEIKAAAPAAEIVDFGEAVLLPPLVNAHTHLELTHFPRWAQSAGISPRLDTFVDWIRYVIRVKRQVTGEGFALSITAGIKESLAAGTGAIGDILSCFSARAAYASSPLYGRIFLEILGQDSQTLDRLLVAIEEIVRRRPNGAADFGFSPHSLYTLPADHLRMVVAAAERHDKFLTIHLAESTAEREFIATSTGPIAEALYSSIGWKDKVPPPSGLSPLAFLDQCGGLRSKTLLAHGVQVTADDIARIAQAGAAVALCPRSNAQLGVGRAPVDLYRKAGVTLSLGTDSRASCDSLSIWDELAFARTWFANDLSPSEWLAVATDGGAKALGLGEAMGQLVVGAAANFQVLTPAFLPSHHELEEFLCSPGRSGRSRPPVSGWSRNRYQIGWRFWRLYRSAGISAIIKHYDDRKGCRMISETGSIVELKGKQTAIVICQKNSFCRHCASMESCQVGDDNRTMLVEAHNAIGGQVGDKVLVVTSSRDFLQSSFLLYIVPLLALIAGGIIGQLLGEQMPLGINPDLLSAILGSAFLVGAFLTIRIVTRALPRENYMPRITEILAEEETFAADLKNGD